MIRVALVTTEFPPFELGGSAESVRLAAEALVRAGHRVTVVTAQWGPSPSTEILNGVVVMRMPCTDLPSWPHPSERGVLSSRWHGMLETAVRGVAHAVDVLHAQDRRVLAPTMRAGLATKVPVVVTLRDVGLLCPIATCLLGHDRVPADCGQVKLWRQCSQEYRTKLAPPWKPWTRAALAYRYAELGWQRRWLRDAACVGFVSDGLRRVYGSAGVPDARVPTAVLPSPVDEAPPLENAQVRDLRTLRRGVPMVLFVGKPSVGKGWPQFADAARRQDECGAVFAQVGPPPRERGLCVQVGPQDRAAVLAWMRAASVVVVPSLQQDALPRVALEAAAQARPVIATRVGGLPEIVEHNVTGLLVEPGADLVPALGRLLRAPSLMDEMGRSARAHVLDRFGAKATTERLVACYEGVRR